MASVHAHLHVRSQLPEGVDALVRGKRVTQLQQSPRIRE